jgi:hypothetical protein
MRVGAGACEILFAFSLQQVQTLVSITSQFWKGRPITLLEAIREANSRGWSDIFFESDSKIRVDAIQTKHNGVS